MRQHRVLTTVQDGEISDPATFGGEQFQHHDSLIVNHVLNLDREATLGHWPKAGGAPALKIGKNGTVMVRRNLTICGDVHATAGPIDKLHHSPWATIAFDSSREPDGNPYTLKLHKPLFGFSYGLYSANSGKPEIVSASHGKPVVLHGEHEHVQSFKDFADGHHDHATPSFWMRVKSFLRFW